MEVKTRDENALRKYLLGDMSAEEQEEFELWLMSDEDAYDLLEAAEDDLIDDSQAGKLKGHELEQFNNRFLVATERQRKLQFGRSLRRFVDSASPGAIPQRPPSRNSAAFWEAVAEFLRYRPVIGYAMSALIVLTVAGSIWSAFRMLELQRQLDSATGQLATARLEQEDLRRQLGESQSLAERLQTQVETLQQSAGAQKSSPPPQALLAFNLMPGLSRSSSDIPKIVITSNTRLAQFSLILLDDNYDAYRVALRDAGGQELWTRDRLMATVARDGKAVVLTVPTERLSDGDYSFGLSGISDSRPPENIASFYFRSVRQ